MQAERVAAEATLLPRFACTASVVLLNLRQPRKRSLGGGFALEGL